MAEIIAGSDSVIFKGISVAVAGHKSADLAAFLGERLNLLSTDTLSIHDCAFVLQGLTSSVAILTWPQQVTKKDDSLSFTANLVVYTGNCKVPSVGYPDNVPFKKGERVQVVFTREGNLASLTLSKIKAK